MKKLLFAFAIIIAFVSVSTYVSASKTEFDTDQTCNIAGTIQSVAHKEAYKDHCLRDGSCPVGAYNPDQPEKYEFKILLISVSCEPDKSDILNSYQSQFLPGEEIEVYINKNIVRKGDYFEVGQKINGKIKYFFGHSFTSYTLEESLKNNVAVDEIDMQNNMTNSETEKIKSEDDLFKRIWKWFLSLF